MRNKKIAELSGEFSGAICLKTLVLLGRALDFFRKMFGTVRAIFWLWVFFWLLNGTIYFIVFFASNLDILSLSLWSVTGARLGVEMDKWWMWVPSPKFLKAPKCLQNTRENPTRPRMPWFQLRAATLPLHKEDVGNHVALDGPTCAVLC